MSTAVDAPSFVISLDLELFWGMFDVTSLRRYRPNILGVRAAVPGILKLFREYDVGATWATVGFVTFANKRELLERAPNSRPEFDSPNEDPYVHLETVGPDEARDPYHFGYSLVQRILDTPGMELGSHTFSHMCALATRRNQSAFRDDLVASRAALARFGAQCDSLVFPRNQYDAFHLNEAAAAGMVAFRGTEDHPFYRNGTGRGESAMRRAGRLLDAHVNLSGHHISRVSRDPSGLWNVPASRFLRPVTRQSDSQWSPRRQRILRAMRAAAHTGGGFHLWWHPHNFGAAPESNLAFLRVVLDEFRRLHDECGMCSLTMRDAARAARER